MNPLNDVFPIENGDLFHCYVHLPEGIVASRGLWMPLQISHDLTTENPNKPF